MLHNLGVLLADQWQPIAVVFGWVILAAVLWGIVLFIIGLGAGVWTHRLMRRRHCFDAPWPWYRTVRWLWAVLFVVSGGAGMGYAGAWWGGGRCLKGYIREGRILDAVVCRVMCVAVMEQTEYELKGKSTAEEFESILSSTVELAEVAEEEMTGALLALKEQPQQTSTSRWIVRMVVAVAGEKLIEGKMHGIDPRLFFALAISQSRLDAYSAQHPRTRYAVAGLASVFDTIREQACGLVNGVVYPNVFGGVGIGLGAPILLALLFRWCVRKWAT